MLFCRLTQVIGQCFNEGSCITQYVFKCSSPNEVERKDMCNLDLYIFFTPFTFSQFKWTPKNLFTYISPKPAHWAVLNTKFRKKQKAKSINSIHSFSFEIIFRKSLCCIYNHTLCFAGCNEKEFCSTILIS